MNKNLKTVIIGASVLAGAIGLFFLGKGIVKQAKAKGDKKRKERLKEENDNFKPILIPYDSIPKDINSDNMNIIWNLIDKTTIPDHLMK